MYYKIGLMIVDNSICNVYANVPEWAEEGQPLEVFVDAEFAGARILSNVMITEPLTAGDDVYQQIMRAQGCIGVFTTNTHVYTMRDDVIEVREMQNVSVISDKISYDTFAELDDFDIDNIAY